jgi:hypothetical protein
MRQAQLSPPAPQPPNGWAEEDARGALAPTIPGLERRLVSCSLWQPGHEGVRAAVTKASNCRLQSLQEYSKIGMDQS